MKRLALALALCQALVLLPCAAAAAAARVTLAPVATAAAAPAAPSAPSPEAWARAEEAYAGGDLAGALTAARAALAAPLPPSQEARVHAVLAAVRAAEGSESGASDELVEAFASDPLLALDPVLFPPDVRALAERVRTERRADIERRRQERQPPSLAPAPPPPAAPAGAPPASILVALAPFGAGQFQNDEPTKGAILAGLEALAAIAAVGGVTSSLSLRDEAGRYAPEDAATARTLNVVWLAGAYGFLALHGYGVTDALLQRDAGP